ncbi:protein STAY-GREEN homolog, chloroplastic-like [Salvia miltiorrhiza]|uniref:protein STAY-GREEN homolog, chloroplastic-like n=1 Tax=Salvia miltiorrhiza TaxID=226208 RepID=UPI0025AC12F0|nr:protein STAY-GREEN homolog, chloroplastic-like [Salvia miltiorrhiza]
MVTLETALLPSKLRLSSPPFTQENCSSFLRSASRKYKKYETLVPVARLLGPAVFEASKLKVVYVNSDEEKLQPPKLPRTYTLTHCDLTAKLTLAISESINTRQLQGWYNRLQRDEVVGVWRKIKGKMSLHVHCHISGGHFLLDILAKLRYQIFCKELPMVLKAFVHGDEKLFKKYPEMEEALAWIYFHSNIPEFNRVECWGPLYLATGGPHNHNIHDMHHQPCQHCCTCCTPNVSKPPGPTL